MTLLTGPKFVWKPLLLKGKYDKEKNVSDFFEHIQSQRTLWSSSASDFSKKKLMMTKHFQSNTHFFREHYYYKLYPPNQNECQKNILRDFSTKIQISNLIYFKSLLDNRLPKLAKKGTSTVQIKDKNDL